MTSQWLDKDEVRRYLKEWSPEMREVAWELRALVQEAAPQLQETINFNALCYSKPGQPYGVIGGNVCMICPKGAEQAETKGNGGAQGDVPPAPDLHASNGASSDSVGRHGGRPLRRSRRHGAVVHLAFIHGAALPDPDGLLQGKAKAKRFVPLRSRADIRAAAFRDLIRAAVSYDPAAGGSGG